MSAKHTTGRISVKGTRLRADDYPGIDCLATMQVSNQPMWEQDARRLVACWNACDGMPTELLEAYPAPFSQLRAQRDELLKALKRMEVAFTPFAKDSTLAVLIDEARAAIAMASTPAAPPAGSRSG